MSASVFRAASGRVIATLMSLTLLSLSSALATEVIGVDGQQVEIKITRDFPLSQGNTYFLIDQSRIRRGIVLIESIVEDRAYGNLMMGNAQPSWYLEIRRRKSEVDAELNAKAHAADSIIEKIDGFSGIESEYFGIPSARQYAFRAAYSNITGSTKNNATTYSVTQNPVSTRAIYSIDPQISIGASWSPNVSQTVDTSTSVTGGALSSSTTSSGLGDPTFFTNYRFGDDQITLITGLGAEISLGPRKDSSMNTGGHSLKPSFGGLVKINPWHRVGAKAEYVYRFNRSTDMSYSVEGGNTFGLEVFYEYYEGQNYLSALLGSTLIYSTNVIVGTRSTTYNDTTSTNLKLTYGYLYKPNFLISISYARFDFLAETNYTFPISGFELSGRYQF